MFSVPYFSVLEIADVDRGGERPSSWFLDVSETGESTKCTRVGVVEGTAGEKK